MAEKKGPAKPSGDGPMAEFLDLYGKAIDALVKRSKTEEVFSPDLAGSVEPTLESLARTKSSMIRTVQEEIAKAPSEAQAAFDEQVDSVGANHLLTAAIAAAQTPPADVAVSVRDITIANGARRIPWLEIVKEILNVLLDLIPGIPDFLKKLLKELLKILDKLFGGMPHEDHAVVST